MSEGTREQAQTPIEVPWARKKKSELVRIVEMMAEYIKWYVNERNTLIAERTHTQALVAAALRKAAESVEEIHYNFPVLTVQGALDHAAMRVRKLISSDTQATLDALVREARLEEHKIACTACQNIAAGAPWRCDRRTQLKAEQGKP